MTSNPYDPPSQSLAAVGVLSGSREDLRMVAIFQKGVLVCILIYIVALIAQFVVPLEIGIAVGLAVIVSSVVGAVFVFMLAIKVYGVGIGILLGILCLMPCIGLISLLVVNGKATGVLQQNGIKVGLLGAKLAEVK